MILYFQTLHKKHILKNPFYSILYARNIYTKRDTKKIMKANFYYHIYSVWI